MKDEEIKDWKTTEDGVHIPIGENGDILYDDKSKKKAIAKLAGTIKKVVAKKQKASYDAKQKIADLVQRFRDGERIDLETELMDIDSRTQKAIKGLVGDETDIATISLHLDEIKHMENDHGENGSANHDMKDLEDYKSIIDTITNHDEAQIGTKNGKPRYSYKYRDKDNKAIPEVEFRKNTGDEERLAVLAIGNNKKKVARIITSYIAHRKNKKK